MTIKIKPTSTTATIEHNDSTILTVDSSGNITPSNQMYPKVPAFSAYANSTQSFSVNTFTKLEMDVEEFDTTSDYDTTLYRYTPSVAGYYQFNLTYKLESGNARGLLTLYKNNSAYYRLLDIQATFIRSLTSSCLAYANGSTDYFEMYAYRGNAGSSAADNRIESQFSAHLVSV